MARVMIIMSIFVPGQDSYELFHSHWTLVSEILCSITSKLAQDLAYTIPIIKFLTILYSVKSL